MKRGMPVPYLPAETVADIWRWADTPIPPCATVSDAWTLNETGPQ